MPSSSERLACRIVAAVLLLATSALAAGRVTVAPEATITADVVRLGEMAALEGPAAEALRDVPLGPAPAAGEMRTLGGAAILHALTRAGLDPGAVTYTIPPLVRVRRAAQEVPEPAVRDLVEVWVRETLGSGAADATVRSVELPGVIRIPVGPYRARIVMAPTNTIAGRVRLQIEFVVADRPVRTVWVTADIERLAAVVVLRRPIARGEMIVAADLEMDRREVGHQPGELLGDATEIAGRVARTPLLPWTPVRRDQIEVAATVRRGDPVQLVFRQDGLHLSAPGEVREDAAAGAPVRAFNRSSRREVVGRVVDARTVAVEF